MNSTEGLPRSAPEPGTAHLAVLHHGLWGSCRDLYFVEAKLIENGWLVLNSTCNSERYTYDGIDVCGDRLVRETRSSCNRWLSKGIRVSKISFIGYSLGGGSEDLQAGQVLAATLTPVIYVSIASHGARHVTLGARSYAGLVVRYAIGKLQATGFFVEVQPVNVVTFASPHLGAYRQPGATATERLCNIILPWTLSRTGAQLVLGDDFLGGLPLLFVMAHPQYAFVQALQCFENRILLANVRGDTTVPYFSAAMCMLNPIERSPGLPLSAKYPCILNTEHRNQVLLLGPSTAGGLPPLDTAVHQFGPLPLHSPLPTPAPLQSQSHTLLCKQGSRRTFRLDGGQGSSQHGNAAVSSRLQQPQPSTALQIINLGSRSIQLRTSMGRARIHDHSFAPVIRQGLPLNLCQHGHQLSLRQALAGVYSDRSSRQRDVVPGRQGDLYQATAGWRGGVAVGRFDRHDRHGRKLGRLDSTSFILLLPLFLMVWVFMVALLTLWGMRHYLTRVSVGIPRDRTWSVHVMQGDAAVMVDGRDGSGGGARVSRRCSNDSSMSHTMYINGAQVKERGSSSSSVLQIRGPSSSHGGSGSDSGAGMRISHTSDDLSGDECDGGPSLVSVADEIRGMAAACRDRSGDAATAATTPASPSVLAIPSASHVLAKSTASSNDGRFYTNSESLAHNVVVHGAAGDEHQPQHSHLQPRTPEQQAQQPWLWSAYSNASSPLLTATNTVPPPSLFRSGEAACCTHSCREPTGSGPSTLPSLTHLQQQYKLDVTSPEGLPDSAFPFVHADICAHSTNTHLHTSDSTMHSLSQGRCASASGCSLALLCKLCEAHLSSGRSCALTSQDDLVREPQASTTSLDVCSPSKCSLASGSRPPVRRKLHLYSESELSACGFVAQCGIGGVTVAVANVTCSSTLVEVCSLQQLGTSSSSCSSNSDSSGGGIGSGDSGGRDVDRRSSSGVEDVCSSGEFSIDCVDAESHARSLCLAGSSGCLRPLSDTASNEMPSLLPRTCLAHPLVSGRRSRSCSPTPGNAFQTHTQPEQSHLLNSVPSSTSTYLSNHRDILILPSIDPASMSSPFRNQTLLPAEAAAVVVDAALTATSTTSLITSRATAPPQPWFVLAGSAASFALLKSASFIPGSSYFSKMIPDPEAFSLRPALGLSRRQWQDLMMENMNGLRWQKIHVDTHHYHAHAAIVVRSYRRFPAQEHIVEYLVRQMRL